MDDIPVLQIIGALLFAGIAIGLFAIQFERLARYRWLIFLGCLTCFAGTAIVGWLTYVPSARGPFSVYEEIRNAGGGGFFGGGRSGDATTRKGAGGGSGDQDRTAGVGDSGSAAGRAGHAASAGTHSGHPPLSSTGTFSDCAKCPVMVMIPAGEIDIGIARNNAVQTRIRIAREFAVSRYEIKVDEFLLFAHETGFAASGSCNTDGIGGASADFKKPGLDQTRHHPVVCVSIDDARRYVAWLSARAKVRYQLLSEARWEYVRRGATSPLDAGGNTGKSTLTDDGNVKWDGWVASTTPGGRYAANRFNVHDMMGNAAEWTADCWYDDLLDVPSNGRARISSGDCSAHAVRGGSWDARPKDAGSASRRKMPGDTRDWRIGFRVMRSVADDIAALQ